MQQADTVLIGFAHADDSAAADGDARAPDRVDGAQAVVVTPRGDDLAVKFRRSVEVVVVRSETRVGEAPRLSIAEHPQRATHFHSERRDDANHLQYIFKFLPVAHFTPRRSHAKPRSAFGMSLARRFGNLLDAEQILMRHAR